MKLTRHGYALSLAFLLTTTVLSAGKPNVVFAISDGQGHDHEARELKGAGTSNAVSVRNLESDRS